MAKEKIEQMKEQYVKDRRQGEMPDALAAISKEYAEKTKTPKEYRYLDGCKRRVYARYVKICQEFAILNRQTIADKIRKFIGANNVTQFETIHNFIDDKNISGGRAQHLHIKTENYYSDEYEGWVPGCCRKR